MHPVIPKIRSDFKKYIDHKSKQSFQRFFKERVKYYGVKTGLVHQIARTYWPQIKVLPKPDAFAIFETLLASDYCEEAFMVSSWAPKLIKQFEPKDLDIFERWIDRYINNWAKCDSFCNHTVGDFIEKHPQSISRLKIWAKSQNRWLKRAAAVSLIVPAKRGKYLNEVFAIADLLLLDPDDMVQKGYGWLLKEASRQHQQAIFDYVVKNKQTMPRTALRYAIELMPQNLKQIAMKRE